MNPGRPHLAFSVEPHGWLRQDVCSCAAGCDHPRGGRVDPARRLQHVKRVVRAAG